MSLLTIQYNKVPKICFAIAKRCRFLEKADYIIYKNNIGDFLTAFIVTYMRQVAQDVYLNCHIKYWYAFTVMVIITENSIREPSSKSKVLFILY